MLRSTRTVRFRLELRKLPLVHYSFDPQFLLTVLHRFPGVAAPHSLVGLVLLSCSQFGVISICCIICSLNGKIENFL